MQLGNEVDNDDFFSQHALKTASDLDSCQQEKARLEYELEKQKEAMYELGERILEIEEAEKLLGAERLEWLRQHVEERRNGG
jgi:hypothetical protein